MNDNTKITIGNCDFIPVYTYDTLESGWIQHFHYHGTYEIQYIGKGDIYCYTNLKRDDVVNGGIYLIPPKLEHCFIPHTERKITKIAIRFSIEKNSNVEEVDLHSEFHRLFSGISNIITLENTKANVLFSLLADELRNNSRDKYIINNYISLIFLSLLDEMKDYMECNGQSDLSGTPSERESLLSSKLESYIANNYMNSLTLNSVADALFISPKQLERLCVKVFKSNFTALVQKQRMIISEQLILENNLTLAQIASKVGFNSYVGFYKSFLKYYTFPPYKLIKEKMA